MVVEHGFSHQVQYLTLLCLSAPSSGDISPSRRRRETVNSGLKLKSAQQEIISLFLPHYIVVCCCFYFILISANLPSQTLTLRISLNMLLLEECLVSLPTWRSTRKNKRLYQKDTGREMTTVAAGGSSAGLNLMTSDPIFFPPSDRPLRAAPNTIRQQPLDDVGFLFSPLDVISHYFHRSSIIYEQ